MKDAGANKINVIKVVKEITGLGLVESKGLVDNCPSPIKENISVEEAEEIKKKATELGKKITPDSLDDKVEGVVDSAVDFLTDHLTKKPEGK